MSVAEFATCTAAQCPAGATLSVITAAIFALVRKQCDLADSTSTGYPPDTGPTINNNEVFEFIVVGGGTAGSVVARRLAERKKGKVLLIEAGGLAPATSKIPGLFTDLLNTNVDWQYRYVKDDAKVCASCKDGQASLPAGKMLGGTSSLHAMLYTRGNQVSYNEWARAAGTDWSYSSVTEAFMKSEKCLSMDKFTLAQYQNIHSTNGLLATSISDSLDDDINSKVITYDGYGLVEDEDTSKKYRSLCYIEKGERTSTASAFLTGSSSDLGDLVLALNTQVEKVNFNGAKKAIGVTARIGSRLVRLNANKEVILCAGTVRSPQILTLSGIADAATLTRLQITKVAESPKVGKNMRDFLTYLGMYYKVSSSHDKHLQYEEDPLITYLSSKTGPLAKTNFYDYILRTNTAYDPAATGLVNIIIHNAVFGKGSKTQIQSFFNLVNLKTEIVSQLTALSESATVLLALPFIVPMAPVGYVEVVDKNINTKPVLHYENAAHSAHVDIFVNLIKTYVSKRFVSEVEEQQISIPECNTISNVNDKLKCRVRHLMTPFLNPIGTCAMGNLATDVLSPRFLVNGVTGLRVVDASVIPVQISAHRHAPTVMLAEKASTYIINDYSM